MRFFRELGHFLRFFWKTDANTKQVVFYAEHEGYFAYLEGLVNELTEARHTPLCYVTSDPGDPVLSLNNPNLKAFYIKSLLPWFMQLVRCRVFVMTLTDLNRFHLKRSVHGGHYVYAFHSMVSTHMMYRAGAFDHYDSILCVGPYHVDEIRAREAREDLAARQLVEAGYYRLERLYERATRPAGEKADPSEPSTVLIAPSWGEHNLLKEGGARLIDALLGHGHRVIVRPHPETIRRDPGLIKTLESAFKAHPDFELERSVSSDDSLLAADILLCDLSGVALEYALGTERPVIFFDLPAKVHNPDYDALGLEPIELALRDQLGQVVSIEDLEGLPDAIDRLLQKRAEYRPRLAALRRAHLFEFGRSSQVGADHILRVVDNRETEPKE